MSPIHSIDPTRDWDDAFANSAYIPGSDALPESWACRAAAYRAAQNVTCDLPYGDGARERFDLVWPAAQPKGLAVFVHGGYWLDFDKSYWTHFAEGARANGWAVAVPSYTLAPEAGISTMVVQIGQAIGQAAQQVAGPIRLSGHSAGGHLVSRMICDDSPLDLKVHDRLAEVVAISGIYDLRPLLFTRMNDALQLDAEAAAAESPALQNPQGSPRLTCWVGGAERPEFIRQARLMTDSWVKTSATVSCEIDPARHHFDVIDALTDPHSALTQRFVGKE